MRATQAMSRSWGTFISSPRKLSATDYYHYAECIFSPARRRRAPKIKRPYPYLPLLNWRGEMGCGLRSFLYIGFWIKIAWKMLWKRSKNRLFVDKIVFSKRKILKFSRLRRGYTPNNPKNFPCHTPIILLRNNPLTPPPPLRHANVMQPLPHPPPLCLIT